MEALRYSLAAALLVTAAAASAKAGPVSGFTNVTVPEVQNTIIDTSNDAFFMSSSTRGLSVGDVVVGFAQINQDNTPGNPGLNKNTIYAVFSAQVVSFNSTGTLVEYFPTTESNSESLQSILKGIVPASNLPIGSLAAVFEVKGGTFPNDLIGLPPPASITNMSGYLQNIAKNGTFDFTAGFSSGHPDFFETNLGTIGAPPTQLFANATFGTHATTASVLNSLGTGIQFGQNFGGLTVLANATKFTFAETVQGQDLNNHQIVITASSENGANGAVGQSVFTAGANAGTTDKSTFLYAPSITTVVPEPSSIVLLGCGLAGFFGIGLRRKTRLPSISPGLPPSPPS
jgi:hypothetical protein